MASMVGTWESEVPVINSGNVPPVSGIPATEMLSFSATVTPDNRVSIGVGDLIAV